MLSLTRKADYAFVAMAELARHSPHLVSAREISRSIGVGLPILTNILHRLLQQGLVTSTMGSKGGYQLARPPDRINLADMIDAIEGPFKLAVCCGDHGSMRHDDDCELSSSCRIKEPVRRVHQGLRDYLSGVSLAELAFDRQTVELRTPGN